MDGYAFTVDEVEKLLPEVAFLVEEAVSVYHEMKETYTEALKVKTVQRDGSLITQNFPFKKHMQVLNEELNDVLEEIEEIGVVVRDLETGLVDFPGVFEGKDIYYCWRLGEDRVEHWHYADEGSNGRKRIIRLG